MNQITPKQLEEIINKAVANLVTKDDAKQFATKDDLKNFATKDDIAMLKDELKATEERLTKYRMQCYG